MKYVLRACIAKNNYEKYIDPDSPTGYTIGLCYIDYNKNIHNFDKFTVVSKLYFFIHNLRVPISGKYCG